MVAVLCAQRQVNTTAHAAVYRRRQPERGTVYQVVQGHLETWLAGLSPFLVGDKEVVRPVIRGGWGRKIVALQCPRRTSYSSLHTAIIGM